MDSCDYDQIRSLELMEPHLTRSAARLRDKMLRRANKLIFTTLKACHIANGSSAGCVASIFMIRIGVVAE